MPREAVTKFLLCCIDCQKRTNEDRKTSPLVSSSSSHDSTCQSSKLLDENFKLDETNSNTCEKPHLREKITQSYHIANHRETFNDQPITEIARNDNQKTYESNNNIINKTQDRLITPSTPIYQNNHFAVQPNDDSIDIQNLITRDYATDAYDIDRLRTRKRKRKFTRKIVRPSNKANFEPCELTYSPFCCPTSTPFRQNGQINPEFIGQRTESSGDSIIHEIQSSIKQVGIYIQINSRVLRSV